MNAIARWRAAPVLFGFSLLWPVPPARAEERTVDLELVLAVDVSWSMDTDEQMLQRDGFVAAFRDPEVIRAIETGLLGRIAVTYVEWAGTYLQRVIVPWTEIDGAGSAKAFAERLAQAPLGRLRKTSISGAIEFSAPLFGGNEYQGMRRVIDVSGDGPNNEGTPVEVARDRAVADGITINGLPIYLKPRQGTGFYNIENLADYYEDCVIGGTGAFVLPVAHRSELAPAIRRKLILEIAGGWPRLILAQGSGWQARSDCLIGEKLWQRRMRDLE